MHAHERHQQLEDLLSKQGTIIVSEVARKWKVSEMTIRRDLAQLAASGLVARVHGGAMAQGSLRWSDRADRFQAAKMRAVRKLADCLNEGSSFYLDGSTTVAGLIPLLAKRRDIVVATCNIDTFQRLVTCPGLMPLLIGGELNRRTDNFGGPVSRLALESLTFDTAFFSAYGLHPEFGLSDPEQDDAEIKRLVCKRSRRQAIAVSHDKLGLSAAGAWMPNKENSILATDLNPIDQRLFAFQSLFQSIL